MVNHLIKKPKTYQLLKELFEAYPDGIYGCELCCLLWVSCINGYLVDARAAGIEIRAIGERRRKKEGYGFETHAKYYLTEKSVEQVKQLLGIVEPDTQVQPLHRSRGR